MMTQRVALGLTAIKVVLLVLLLAPRLMTTAQAQGIPHVLRGHSLEILDTKGRVRASISIYDDAAQTQGEALAPMAAEAAPTFEMATIKPAERGPELNSVYRLNGRRFVSSGTSLKELITVLHPPLEYCPQDDGLYAYATLISFQKI